MTHITFIHGIANKPEAEDLHRLWRDALATAAAPLDLAGEGITSTMVYWADVLYASPLEAPAPEASEEAVAAATAGSGVEAPQAEAAPTAAEAAWIGAMEQRLGIGRGMGALETAAAPPPGTMAHGLERVPLPGFVKDAFLERFLRDVHHYLFNASHSPRPGATYRVQDEIRARTIAALRQAPAAAGPHVLVTHSMGTVIAYDCLKRAPECPAVDALVTLGSPLGIDEVQDKLHPEWTRDDGFPAQRLRGRWLNIFDPLDVVARLDPYLASDFREGGKMRVKDARQSNDGWWCHDVVKYLRGKTASKGLRGLLS